MDKIKHCITLDMHAATAQTALSVKKGDTARKLIISLYADGKPYRPAEGCTAVLTAKKPDGNILYNACTISDGKIAYTFTPQTTSAAGDAECEVRVYDPDEQLITSPRFLLRVDPTVYNDGDTVESATEVSALTALVSETTALKNEVERKLADGEFVGAKGDKGDPGEKGDTGAAGAVGAAGRGISSFAKTGVEAASVTSPAQVSDIWRMQYDDRTGVNVKIPRGARWFTCAALEALADSETVADYAVGAVMGDYLLSTVTGNVWRKAADTGNLWNAIGCIKGAAGAKGDTGADGSPGAKGDKGDTGADGAPGAKGDKGDKGDPGEKGDKGDPGEPGTDAEVTLAKIFELYDGAVAQRALQITDAVPLKQRSGSAMAKVTLQVLRSFVLDSVKNVYNDEGYSAALPDEMGADGVLALASDIPADFTADEIAALWDAN